MKLNTIQLLLQIEKLLSFGSSDDYERYTKLALQVQPDYPLFLSRNGVHGQKFCHRTLLYINSGYVLLNSLKSRAFCLAARQQDIPWLKKDYSYIDFFRKAYENGTSPEQKMVYLHELRDSEARRDFFTGSVRQIHNLIQIGSPNLELKEARCEIYKISISFRPRGKII